VRVFRKVFVDIGDEQSIENDLSTFSSHLMNLKTIIGEADRDSLVLIDEVGSGTDPAEGSAIAASVLTSLTERGTLTIATTHHGALKVFAHETPGIENGAMEFDRTTLTPTYRFRSGVPGSSYALEMASRLGFSDSMLNRSREFLGTEQTKLNDLIGELETSIMRYRKDLESVAEMKTQLTGMIRQYESRNAGQAKELKEMKRRAIEEARQILDSANSAIERCIREIRESRADKGAIKHARGEVERLKGEIQNLRAETVKPGTAVSEPLVAGSIVTLAGGVEEGEVISIASDRNTAVVAFGSIRMNVPIPDLVPVQGRPGNIYRSGAPHMERRESLRQDLDVRGMTGEEALPLVDKFLDDAILVGLHRVDIIHGKGTGALKKKVAQFLSTHPRVKSFRLGEWNEGGAGATIVELTDS
jgi:DNA mismatch repair protein MutS2